MGGKNSHHCDFSAEWTYTQPSQLKLAIYIIGTWQDTSWYDQHTHTLQYMIKAQLKVRDESCHTRLTILYAGFEKQAKETSTSFYQFSKTLPVVPHNKDRKLSEKWVVVMRGWQSEPTDGSKGGWGSEYLSLSPSLSNSRCHLLFVPLYLIPFLRVYLLSSVVVVVVVL